MRKLILNLSLIFFLATNITQLYAQVPVNQNAYKPGFFFSADAEYSQINNIYNEQRYNCIRTALVSYHWRSATSLQDFKDRILGLNGHPNMEHRFKGESQQVDGDYLILLTGTPPWASDQLDQTPLPETVMWKTKYPNVPGWDTTWRAAMTFLAQTLKTWTPTMTLKFELWNEPDGFWWNGSEAELFDLYRVTSEALRVGDSTCKTGGLGLHTAFEDVDRFTGEYHIKKGYYQANDTLYGTTKVKDYSMLMAFIDYCATNNYPLDFITYHDFHSTSGYHRNAHEAFRQYLDQQGFPNAKIFVTEMTTTLQHPAQPSGMFSRFVESAKTGVDGICKAAIQDFWGTNGQPGTWGTLTRSLPIKKKPVWNGMNLLYQLQQGDTIIDVIDNSTPITNVVGSKSGSTLNVMIGRYQLGGLSNGREHFYYDGNGINETMLLSYGYGAGGNAEPHVDSIIKGVWNSFGPAHVDQKFTEARAIYNYLSVQAGWNPDSMRIRFPGNSGSFSGEICVITRNNVNGDSLVWTPISGSGDYFDLTVDYWDLVYVKIDGLSTINAVFLEDHVVVADLPEIPDMLNSIYPNPNNGLVNVQLNNAEEKIQSIQLFDLLGILVMVIDVNEMTGNQFRIAPHLLNGNYFLQVITNKFKHTQQLLLVR